jgi:hypothetical protein
MTIDRAQSWWDKTKVDLRLRRGESGRKLLEIAGEVGYSPYRLRRALERILPVLKRWVCEDQAPAWAERLLRQCKQFLPVVAVVPPLGDEMEA